MITPKALDSAVTNGNALRSALEGITDAGYTNPYLIKLGPGSYYTGTTSLAMKQYVDIEGSGENTTVIYGGVDGSGGVINGASFAELRFLTVSNYSGGSYAKGIYIHGSSPSITSVTVNASGGSTLTTGIEISTTSSSASPRLKHVNVNVNIGPDGSITARGIDINGNSFPSLFDVEIDAWNGTTETAGIYMNGAQPEMNNVSIHVQGGGQGINYGIQSLATWSDMSNLKIVVLGPSTGYGIYTGTSGILRVKNSDIDGATFGISNGTGAYWAPRRSGGESAIGAPVPPRARTAIPKTSCWT